MNCTSCNGHMAKDEACCKFCGRVKPKKTTHQKALELVGECEPALLSIFEELSAAATYVREAKADALIGNDGNVFGGMDDAVGALENAVEEINALSVKISRFVEAKKKEGA